MKEFSTTNRPHQRYCLYLVKSIFWSYNYYPPLMAKPTKQATPISLVCTVAALIGIIIGILVSSALVTMIFLLPTILYEVYRVEGRSTRWASWGILGVFVVEIGLILFKIEYDLSQYLGLDEKYIQGYDVPVGDIKLLGPTLMAIFALVLVKNTRGKYTKWLAAVILVTSFAIIYTLDSTIFERFVRIAVDEGFNNLN